MKFKMKLAPAVYALTGSVIVITAAAAVINILILTNTGRFVNGSVAVTAVSLACSLLLCIVCAALLLNSNYTFKEKELWIWFGLYPLRLPYDKILAAAEENVTRKLYIQYASSSPKKDYDILAVNILPSLNKDFIDNILKKNPDIKHEGGNPPDED